MTCTEYELKELKRSIASSNSLAPNRQQVNMLTNVDKGLQGLMD